MDLLRNDLRADTCEHCGSCENCAKFSRVEAAIPSILSQTADGKASPTFDFVAATYRWVLQSEEHFLQPFDAATQHVLEQVRKKTYFQSKNIGYVAWPPHLLGPLQRTAAPLKTVSEEDVMGWLCSSTPRKSVKVTSNGTAYQYFAWLPASQETLEPECFHAARYVNINRHGVRCVLFTQLRAQCTFHT
jgi:hypothetical protein